jgi:hypothetical protein
MKYPKEPTENQLKAMKARYEVNGSKLLSKVDYHKLRVGREVGCETSYGYRQVKVLGRLFLTHHIVWFLSKGRWPKLQIDHMNGDKLDNRPENLRELSQGQNVRSFSPIYGAIPFRGVCFIKSKGKFLAQASHNNKRRHIGYYDTAEKAALARDMYVYHKLGYNIEAVNSCNREAVLDGGG